MRVRPHPPIETVMLAWYCDGCGLVIPNGAGWIEVNYLDVANAQERDRRVRANVKSKADAGSTITPADLSNLPPPVRWMAWHQDCAPPDQSVYRMPVTKVRTLDRLIDLHGRLADTSWQHHTDFFDLSVFLGSTDTPADTADDADTDTDTDTSSVLPGRVSVSI